MHMIAQVAKRLVNSHNELAGVQELRKFRTKVMVFLSNSGTMVSARRNIYSHINYIKNEGPIFLVFHRLALFGKRKSLIPLHQS